METMLFTKACWMDLEGFWARLAEAGVPFVLHVGGAPLQVAKDWGNNGRGAVKDWLGGGENVRTKDAAVLHQTPEMFISMLLLDGVFDRHPGLRGAAVELGAGRRHTIAVASVQDGEELATVAVLEEHVQLVLVLVGVVQRQDERVVAHEHDVLLVHHVVLLLVLDHLLLVQHLQREHLLAHPILDELHAAEGARADGGEHQAED